MVVVWVDGGFWLLRAWGGGRGLLMWGVIGMGGWRYRWSVGREFEHGNLGRCVNGTVRGR